MSDEDIALLQELYPGITEECVEIVRLEGVQAMPRDVRDCFVMNRTRRYSGYWLLDFETSLYCEQTKPECIVGEEGRYVWLTFDDDAKPEVPKDGIYRIEFTGRRTADIGGFGHEGSADHEVVVEDLITLEAVSPP